MIHLMTQIILIMTEPKTISEQEESTLRHWQTERIFETTVEREAEQGEYVFYDGPPFATGTPHYGHIVGSLMKDAVPRYWTMRGFRVARRWGWDCHGLPIENIVEQELNIKHKKDIEETIGIAKFNETCRSKVLTYADEWAKVMPRIGRWADMEHAYRTMDRDYMESIWWVFKQLWDKNLIYEGYKSMHICPRCETTLSQSEVTEGYKDIEDIGVTVKFKVTNPAAHGLPENTYILAWTTTPWTLPGNVALAVGKDVSYVVFQPKGSQEWFIVAKDCWQNVFGDQASHDGAPIKFITGQDLVGLSYQSLFSYFDTPENHQTGFKVYAADFVTTADGTGVVHIAPAFGEDDMNLGKAHNLPFVQHVGQDGLFTAAVTDFAGQPVKPKENHIVTDEKVIAWLKKNEKWFSDKIEKHSYPHCYRCDTPLLNYATSSWFVNVTTLKPRLLELVKDIAWVPEHIKEGRFGQWLAGARDWSISRQRYWGSVMPIWQCVACKKRRVFGSVAELEQASGQTVSDLHKHVIDPITVPCECSGVMHRIPDVLDCWFESGSMPYAQLHYPFENKDKFERNFPAQFIAEGADQCRAWFYYLVVLAGALFDSIPFNHVIVNGIVLAEDGKKMSKRLRNYPDPMELIGHYGADALRYYLLTSAVMKADTLNFSEKGVSEVYKKLILMLENVQSFYRLFADSAVAASDSSPQVLDNWIINRTRQLVAQVTDGMNGYDLPAASRPIQDFVNDLSTWYVQCSRDRFKGSDVADMTAALATLRFVLLTLAKVTAPFTPFMAERLYQTAGGEMSSVHLETWPETQVVDQLVLQRMATVRSIVEAGLAARAKEGIKVRQPLASYSTVLVTAIEPAYREIIIDKLNVKELSFGTDKLNTALTPELKAEGLIRELVRQINSLRREQKLTIQDIVPLVYATTDADIAAAINRHQTDLQKETRTSAVTTTSLSSDSDLPGFIKLTLGEGQSVWVKLN